MNAAPWSSLPTRRWAPSDAADHPKSDGSQPLLELNVKVYQILFIVWVVVFLMWLFKQFAQHNRDKDNGR